jgi:hypothetical protein
MSAWDEAAGRVSQSFSDWFLIDGDQRAFLGLGLAFAEEVYERIWDEAGREPADSDGPEQIDIFEERVHGLHQHDYQWMHCAGILREAVTNYEVYLEKAREEIRRRTGKWQGVPENAPYWRDLKAFYEQIGADIEVDDIREVRELRHFLAHRRGELRTEKLREHYAAEAGPLGPINVELSGASVLQSLDVLGAAARRIDVAIYRHAWERVSLDEA